MRADPAEGGGGAPSAGAGRICPVDYRYDPSVFDRPHDIEADVLYVAGGAYGNLEALTAIEAMAARERGRVAAVLNGDYHWFDAEPVWFLDVEQAADRFLVLRGNVETEIARATDIGAGCGCVYPAHVDDGVVSRSNLILSALRASAPRALTRTCGARPMPLVARVGHLRIGIVHGDATSLGGWGFDRAPLDDPDQRPWLDEIRAASTIDVFASTHTCTAGLRDFALPRGRLTIANNGAAGMPNFAGTDFGLVTRIATTPARDALYGLVRDGVHVEALPVRSDRTAFLRRFLSRWPEGSPAHLSYYRRLTAGPDDTPARAAPVPA